MIKDDIFVLISKSKMGVMNMVKIEGEFMDHYIGLKVFFGSSKVGSFKKKKKFVAISCHLPNMDPLGGPFYLICNATKPSFGYHL